MSGAASVGTYGTHVTVDQVSSLLDQIYGPSTTRTQSDLRANKVLEKYEGKEELLLEVLEEKAETTSLRAPPIAVTATTTNGDTVTEGSDSRSVAAEATAEAIAETATEAPRSIQGDDPTSPDEGVEVVADFCYADESPATLDPNPRTKKKRNVISRGMRKVSKRVVKKEEATSTGVIEENATEVIEENDPWETPDFSIATTTLEHTPDDVAFEVDTNLTVRQRSLKDDNAAFVVVSELGGIEVDAELKDEHLLSTRGGEELSKKTRSKLRLRSFGNVRKEKYSEML